MKTTKVIFEHTLNDKAEKYRHWEPGQLAGLDDYFEVWKQSGTMQRFGTWLRRTRPAEFIRRHTTWKKGN